MISNVQRKHSRDDVLEGGRRIRGGTGRPPRDVTVGANEHGTVRVDPIRGAPRIRQIPDLGTTNRDRA